MANSAGYQGAADEDRCYEANAAQHDERVGADHHEDRLHHHARDRLHRAGNALALEEREAKPQGAQSQKNGYEAAHARQRVDDQRG